MRAFLMEVRTTRNYFLTTDRLGFGIWGQEDIEDAVALWEDPDVTRYIVAGGVMDRVQIKARLQKEIDTYARHHIQYWPAYLLETGELAGCCGLRPYDAEKDILEMGVHLKKKYWGLGLAAEACRAAILYSFEKLGAQALFAGHNPDNSASAKMLTRLGFTYTHDEYYPPTGMNHPSYLLKKDDFIQQHEFRLKD